MELASPATITGGPGGTDLQGKVTQADTPVSGATVTLRQSGQDIASIRTDANGSYSFENAVPDIYEVVVETDRKTKTSMITVTNETAMEEDLVLPAQNVSSVLKADPDASVVAVGGLDSVALDNAERFCRYCHHDCGERNRVHC